MEKFTIYHLDKTDESSRWDNFVNSHIKGTPFHLTGWIRTISEAYGFRPFLFVSVGEDGKITALIPFIQQRSFFGAYRYVSLPFSDFCGPLGLTQEHTDRIIRQILFHSVLQIKNIEIRGFMRDPPNLFKNSCYKHHKIQLCPDPQTIMKRLDKRTIIYNIRKADRQGVEVNEDNTNNGIEEFYRLNLLTRKKHGIPPQPKRFFLALARNLIDKGQARVLLASYRSEVIAAGVFLLNRKTIYYKYNVSDPEIISKIAGNHLVMWRAIEIACNEGYEFMDLGRTAISNPGLMRYKSMWGAEAHDLPYYSIPASSGIFGKGENGAIFRMATGIWRKLPESLASLIGPRIIKYFS